MKKKCYITTPIYYPSGNPHLGHAYCTTMCDIFARYKKNMGVETYFLTGTDEHGQKIENKAKEENITPQEYVDIRADGFKKLWSAMKIDNNDFIRTTEERHIKVVQQVFSRFLKQDDIYLDHYEGWYCTHCESFWTETQATEAHICPDCGRPVHLEKEESYFFRCKKHIDVVNKAFENPDFLTPVSRKNEMINNFIKPGIEDLCVSRTSFKWGIPVLENENHVVYVWLDALVNYISALGYLSNDDTLFKEFWDDDTEIIHVVGADISRFHTIYWPMFLNCLGLRLPDKVFVHGLIMMKDGKMSKSKGNVISPYPLIEKYGVDTVRYYLAREIPFGQNGTFTPQEFVDRINGDLVNNYGNLVSRTLSMITKYFNGVIPSYEKGITAFDKDLEEKIETNINKYIGLMEDLNISDALQVVMDLCMAANKYIEDNKPWELAKDETKVNELKSVMSHLARVILVSTILLKPVLVETFEKTCKSLGLSNNLDMVSLKDEHLLDGKIVDKTGVLFPRLNVETEVPYIASLLQGIN